MVEYFDADVSLTANFGGTVGADSTPATGNADENDGLLIGAVTGSVSGIRAGGMDVDGMLTLKRAPVIAGAENGDSTGGFDGDCLRFTWRAEPMLERQLGRPVLRPQRRADADSMAARTEYPTTAAGTFAATKRRDIPVTRSESWARSARGRLTSRRTTPLAPGVGMTPGAGASRSKR